MYTGCPVWMESRRNDVKLGEGGGRERERERKEKAEKPYHSRQRMQIIGTKPFVE